VAEILSRIDALIVPSLWLENSPLVIHEAFLAGVPVIGARMGGIPDLVQDGVNGLLYDAWSASDLAAILERVVRRPEILKELAARVSPVKTIEQDAREWMERYADVRRGRPAGKVPT
jgi:glycosyltransferase involved in cell wall biosynthesis